MNDATFRSSAGSGGSTTEQVREQARDKAQVAQDKAKGALGQGRNMLRDQVDQRSTQAGEQIRTTAQDVRGIAGQLREQGKDGPARMAEQVADRVESLGSYLRDADGERLMRDVETYVRRQPWVVVAGGLALGFAASRLLKASSSRRSHSGGDYDYGDGYWSPAGERTDTLAAARNTYATDPAWTGSTGSAYGTEAPYLPADEAATVVTDDSTLRAAPPEPGSVEPGGATSDRRDIRRDRDSLP